MADQQKPRLIAKRFYVYTTTHSSVAASGNSVQSFSIASDSDFWLVKMTHFADIATAVQTDSSRVIPLCTLQLTETNSGNNMFDSAVPVPSLFGTGEIPFILPEAKLFRKNTTVTVSLSNFSASTTYNVRLSFIGYRAFYNE